MSDGDNINLDNLGNDQKLIRRYSTNTESVEMRSADELRALSDFNVNAEANGSKSKKRKILRNIFQVRGRSQNFPERDSVD